MSARGSVKLAVLDHPPSRTTSGATVGPGRARVALSAARGSIAVACAVLWLGVVALPWLLFMSAPAWSVSRGRRLSWVTHWARCQSRVVLGVLRVGGAQTARSGRVPTDAPGLVLMNHQSVLDIPTAILMAEPVVPAFVARVRYASVPVIAAGLWLADCPVVDPGRDREGALAVLRSAVREDRAVLIYPEGHRTPDGNLQPFRTAGLLAMLRERRVPVWLIVTDGFWSGRRLVDLARLDLIRGTTEVLGPFTPPADEAALEPFLGELHAAMDEALRRRRRGEAPVRDESGRPGGLP